MLAGDTFYCLVVQLPTSEVHKKVARVEIFILLSFLDYRLPAFGPVDVSNTLWAFGRLQFGGKQYKVAPNIVRKLLQQAYVVLPQLEPQVSILN
jgi:hypothetical protein